MRITREWLHSIGACYRDSKIDRLAAGRQYITVSGLLKLPIPYRDKMWVLLRKLTEKQLVEFTQSCVDAVAEYAKKNDFAARYAELVMEYAGCTDRATYLECVNIRVANAVAVTTATAAGAATVESKEWERQINWLKEALGANH